MTEAIRVEGLIKTYATSKGRSSLGAVDGIDFTTHAGEAYRVKVE